MQGVAAGTKFRYAIPKSSAVLDPASRKARRQFQPQSEEKQKMELFTKTGRSYERATDEQILSTARAIANRAYVGSRVNLSSPTKTRDFLITQMAGLEHEVFSVIFLTVRHDVIDYEVMFRGTIDGANVHAREVVKAALKRNAGAVIFAHNHPSGVAEASEADERLTRSLRDALAYIDVRVLDHVIVAGTRTMSFAERGML
ncbi:MAG TPA: DNA repair protein RadC [Steroidobacteraceae bacterium]|nr:DNA repair protein RadC [Steroidobacteraceae bacterium]